MGNVKPVIYRGRNLGTIVLTMVQLLVGTIHVYFGLWLFVAGSLADSALSVKYPLVYCVYTLVFGLLTLVFSIKVWLISRSGWVGTFAVSIFVIFADALTLLDLTSIPGIPKAAAVPEIIYSVLVLLYLSQTQVRTKYQISK